MNRSSPVPVSYAVGSRGPAEAYALMKRVGFVAHKLESELLGAKPRTALQQLTGQFHLSAFRMEQIASSFKQEFRRGLSGDPDATVRMLPSYVTRIPTGGERGVFYALDLGGTNFRCTRFCFDGAGGSEATDERKFTVPDEIMMGEQEALFDFLAECVASLDVVGDVANGAVRRYGFTFSFPCQQNALDSATLLSWTKGFTTRGVVGEDVVALLQVALDRRGFPAQIVAVLNDTVGTLVSSAFIDPDTRIGVILGTGTNAAYRERVDNIRSLPEEARAAAVAAAVAAGREPCDAEMVINTEWGNFGAGDSGSALPRTPVDLDVDAASRNKGAQCFEKMISGMYLGELARLCLVRIHAAGEIWAGASTEVPPCLTQEPGSFQTRFLSDIEYDMSEELRIVQRVENQYGIKGSSARDRVVLKEVCGMVIQRAAKLTACAIAAAVRQMGSDGGTVGIDGSVYIHHPSFRQRLGVALGELAVQVNVTLAKDGSGKGAALVACLASPPCPLT